MLSFRSCLALASYFAELTKRAKRGVVCAGNGGRREAEVCGVASLYASIWVYPSLSCHLAGTLEGLSVHALYALYVWASTIRYVCALTAHT